MDTKLLNVVADAIDRSQKNGKRTPMGIAMDLYSACLVQSPETAAERAAAEDALALLDRTLAELKREHAENARLRARIAELEADNAALKRDKEHVAAAAEVRLSKTDVAAWLRKKAREYPTAPERQEDAAFAIARLADKVARGAIRPKVQESADRLTRLLAPTQALRLEDPHDSPLHHAYRLGRDLPEAGAQ